MGEHTILKAQRFWSKNLRAKIELANKALKTKNFTQLEEILTDFVTLLKNPQEDWKDRVAICFILEQMSAIDPLKSKIVDSLMKVLESEQDPHVREFSVWALGKIVERTQSLDLIKQTMSTIIRFLSDDSEEVKALATELHSRFQEVLREKEDIDQQIKQAPGLN